MGARVSEPPPASVTQVKPEPQAFQQDILGVTKALWGAMEPANMSGPCEDEGLSKGRVWFETSRPRLMLLPSCVQGSHFLQGPCFESHDPLAAPEDAGKVDLYAQGNGGEDV